MFQRLQISLNFKIYANLIRFLYKTTNFYSLEHERSISWNDPNIGINWPDINIVLSAKDKVASTFLNSVYFK